VLVLVLWSRCGCRSGALCWVGWCRWLPAAGRAVLIGLVVLRLGAGAVSAAVSAAVRVRAAGVVASFLLAGSVTLRRLVVGYLAVVLWRSSARGC
jgi:hypothetical protein